MSSFYPPYPPYPPYEYPSYPPPPYVPGEQSHFGADASGGWPRATTVADTREETSLTLHAPANNGTPVVIVSKKKTMSKMNLLSANKHIAAQKKKKSKKHQSTAKPSKSKNDKPRSKTSVLVHYSKSDIEIERKKRWKGWEAKIRAILTEMEFQGEFDEVVPEILARAEKHFAVAGGRLRKEAMRDKHVLPYVEEWKAKKEEEKNGEEGGDSPPCEDSNSNDADDMCVGGQHDGDDDYMYAPACDDEDEGDNDNDSSSGVVVPPADLPEKEALDASASSRFNQRIPRKKRFNSTEGTDAGQPATTAAGADSGSSVPAPSLMPAPPSTRKTIKIQAKQDVHLMIVPDQKKGDKKFSTRTVEQRRDAWVKLTDGRLWNGNNKGQKARGLYYSGEAIKNNHKVLKIDLKRRGGVDVEIRVSDTVEGQEDHFVKIHYLSGEERMKFGEKANNFAEKWDEKAFGTSSRRCIQGGMVKCGFGKGAGHHPHFFLGGTWNDMYSDKAKAGFIKGVTKCQEALNVMGKSILQKYFPRAFKSIRKTIKDQTMTVPKEIGGDDGMCMNIIQSGSGLRQKGGPLEGENFTVECHVDSKDLSEYCASIWTSSDSSDPAGWYFVLPFLTCVHNGTTYEGIAIRLRHGVGIEWAGRNLFHCSTAPDTCGIDVNGTFNGVLGATIE